ncbi:protein disulfide oxidoreductase [Anoxynatronum buryatiense]|uniref:Glutaredoxin-like domain protein n=1 Tax=Anoxynatronum buryatiense TaxID=489973 RepID=A0AA45WU54_9CLOT|nr:thioredoxin family protein [Anoxynatronum buryatiense]SMP46482.1 Glutaredoxin-like domain protein [Anoxynatronum buryatiense]
MKLLNDEVQAQLKTVFENMQKDVTIALFIKEDPCETCQETSDFLNELVATSPHLHLKMYDIERDHAIAEQYNVKMVPSIVLLDQDQQYQRIKFNGIPAGHEINSFVKGILEVAGAGAPLSGEVMDRLSEVKHPVNIKVFVTLGCPHCSGAVEKAHKLALSNEYIDAEMIEAQTFYDLSDRFNVSSVPKIVINDDFEFVGNQPLETFLEEIEKIQAVN